jgi:predicted HD superfamily hydrolase involved in NAD metabolism
VTLTFTELARNVREQIGQEHRYAHSVRVARCADILAMRHGVSTRKARVAGMLHDLARLYSSERLIAESQGRGFAISAAEREHPTLLHARLGAALARELFGIDDPQVLSAIEKHTLGAEEMSPLDCVVYLADSLEPHRSFVERNELWQLALRDLRAATAETMRFSEVHHARKRAHLEVPASS